MTEIRKDIHQLKVPIPNNPLECTNVFLIQGDDGNVLIDTGWNNASALQALSDQLSDIGTGFQEISRIVVTHAHFDHYGLAGDIKRLSGAEIALHQKDMELLTTRYSMTEETFRQSEKWFSLNGMPASELPVSFPSIGRQMKQFGNPVMPDIILNDGETINAGNFELQVIWTPGHSPGHICLYEPVQKILFAGDHVLPVITPNISLQPNSDSNPLGDFINSLHKIRDLDVNLVLPAHENNFTDLRKRIDEIMHHHELRNLEIIDAMDGEQKTAYQIAAHITWMPGFGGVKLVDLPPMDKRMAVLETLAHLESMRTKDRVSKVTRDEIIYYFLK